MNSNAEKTIIAMAISVVLAINFAGKKKTPAKRKRFAQRGAAGGGGGLLLRTSRFLCLYVRLLIRKILTRPSSVTLRYKTLSLLNCR